MLRADADAAPPAARGVVLDSYKDEALDTAGDLRELAAAATHGRGRGRGRGRARLSDFVTYGRSSARAGETAPASGSAAAGFK